MNVRNVYLKEMGIDVWILRQRPESVQREPVPVKAGTRTFHLCFLNYQSFGVCLSLGDDQEVISPRAKRFVGDIALSINGSPGRPVLHNLKWPVSRRDSNSQSERTAEEVVQHRLNSLPSLVLVFGGSVVDIIPGLHPDESGFCLLDGRRMLVVDSIDELCRGAAGKRDLWRKLSHWQKLS